MSEAPDPGRTIVRGAQANAVGFVARLGGRLLFVFIAARLYGAQLYGAFVLAVAIVELAVSVGSLATKRILFPLLDREADLPHGGAPGHLILDAALLVSAASLALAAAMAGGALVFATSATAIALVAIAPMIAGQALLDLLLAAVRWRGKIGYEVIARSLVEPWALAGGASLAFVFGWGAYGLAAGYWCGTLAALAYAAGGVARLFPGIRVWRYRPRPAALREILRGAGANSANDFLSALYMRADLYLVGVLLGPNATGVYGMVRQLITPLRQTRQSFDGLLIPAVSRTIGESGAAGAGAALASATRLIFAIQLPLLIALVAVGRPLLAWIGPGFEAGYWPLLILGAAEILQSALGVGDLIFVFLGPRIGLYLTLTSVAAGISAAVLLIPPLGITGAALAALLSCGLRSALRFAVLIKRFGVPIPHAHLGIPLLAAAAAAAALRAGASPALALGASLAIYAAVLAAGLKLTGQRLTLTGFAAERLALATPPPPG